MKDWSTCVKIYKAWIDPNNKLSKRELGVIYGLSYGVVNEITNFLDGSIYSRYIWNDDLKCFSYTTHEIDDVLAFGDFLAKYTDDVYILLKRLHKIGIFTIDELMNADYEKIKNVKNFGNSRLATIRKILNIPEE